MPPVAFPGPAALARAAAHPHPSGKPRLGPGFPGHPQFAVMQSAQFDSRARDDCGPGHGANATPTQWQREPSGCSNYLTVSDGGLDAEPWLEESQQQRRSFVCLWGLLLMPKTAGCAFPDRAMRCLRELNGLGIQGLGFRVYKPWRRDPIRKARKRIEAVPAYKRPRRY